MWTPASLASHMWKDQRRVEPSFVLEPLFFKSKKRKIKTLKIKTKPSHLP